MLFTKCATWQAVYLFPQILKTDFQRDRRKSVFACWWLLPPNPFSQNSILRLRTVPALFLPSPAEIFCKRRGWLTSIIAYCPVNGNGIFSKIRQARRAAASVKRCSKGLGCFPMRFPAMPETAGFVRLYIQTPCLPSSESLYCPPALDKIFPKALTGTSVCAIITGN